MGKPTMEPEQVERVLAGMKKLLVERFENNITRLAEALNRAQPSISDILGGKNNPSHQTAQRVAKLLGVPWWELLGASTPIDSIDRFPARAAAIEACRKLGMDAAAIAEVAAIEWRGDDPGLSYWAREIEVRSERRPRAAAIEKPADPSARVGALSRRKQRKDADK